MNFKRIISISSGVFSSTETQFGSFLRGDSLTITASISTTSKADISKWRCFCYMSTGECAFSKEFTFAEDDAGGNISSLSANFTAEETSMYAGSGILTFQIFSVNGDVINSANVKVKIIESNASRTYIPPEVSDAQRVYDEQGNLLTEKIEWRTIKIAEGVYTQKWVKVQ